MITHSLPLTIVRKGYVLAGNDCRRLCCARCDKDSRRASSMQLLVRVKLEWFFVRANQTAAPDSSTRARFGASWRPVPHRRQPVSPPMRMRMRMRLRMIADPTPTGTLFACCTVAGRKSIRAICLMSSARVLSNPLRAIKI